MIASLSHVRKILDANSLKAKKKIGQNFIIDANVVEKIARNAASKDEITVEIGPGIGSLTEQLLKYAKEVYAYEIDEDMYEILSDTFKGEERLKLNLQDFLELELDEVPYKDEKINVCSNLPYYITTPILFKLFESKLNISKITVMVQKEVAARFRAERGSEDYNALSIIVQYLYEVKQEMNVPKTVFYPAPKVDSAVVSFTPKRERNHEFERGFFDFVKKCFMKRRKTLSNNLKDFLDSNTTDEIYERLKLKPTVRAQELSLEDFLKIYEVLNERQSIRKD